MASKGSRLKLDHEARPKRQKVLDPREPQRPKAHWDHVLEEMVWLSKDFESERKWKLAQAKKVALKASRGFLDQDKRVKGGEQRIRKVALNISKDVKKFWMKIEKLVLFKHQLELDVKKKKVLDKQLEFLLGQTERYSTMLAENLVNSPAQGTLTDSRSLGDLPRIHDKKSEDDEQRAVPNSEPQSDSHDGDYGMESLNESEDDEHTIDEDEALISKEEREEELAALQDEVDLPLEELLKRYTGKVDGESEQGDVVCVTEAKHSQDGKQNGDAHLLAVDGVISPKTPGRRCVQSNGFLSVSSDHFLVTKVQKLQNPSNKFQEIDDKSISDVFSDEPEDKDFVLSGDEDIDNCVDDETTLSEEEELARVESKDDNDEISLLQKESEIPIDELLARYMKDRKLDKEDQDNELDSVDGSVSDTFTESSSQKDNESNPSKVHSSNGPDTTSTRQHVVSSHEESEAKSMGEVGVEEGESRDIIADAAAAARSAQPTGNTFSTAKVRTKYPFLLKFPLREYQHIGLDWLVTLYDKKLNGILADEMGLGKTIMTIALLAHLACEKGIWGPHLIVVPTSVMLNWETEFLKWCPAFKILTYFGSAKERKTKRQGWLKPHSFHVCVTTYRLVIQDSKVFKRKKWKYLILDEAHLIKNWKSLRWQTLLNFNSKRRILITGTPLQNDLMELWSLMHFLMPHIFQSHQEFKDWFCNPINGMVEGQEKVNKEVIDRLHSVLRPFILRRLKRDVEKQLPLKHEHVINCKLSKRQRNLYEDFIASADTQATLASSNFFGMISVIMQLRKVCNHPDLFEGRPIVSSFDMSGFNMQLSTSVCSILDSGPFSTVNLSDLGVLFTHLDLFMTSWEYDEIQGISTPSYLIEDIEEEGEAIRNKKSQGTNIFEEIQRKLMEERCREAKARAASMAWWNSLKCRRKPVYSTSLRDLVTLKHPVYDIHCPKNNPPSYLFSSKLADVIHTPVSRFQEMLNQVESFMFAIPAARVSAPVCWSSRGGTSVFIEPIYKEKCSKLISPLLTPFRPAIVRRQVYFPDRRLIQFDCGKLQKLASLLRRLKLEGHRALIFTQMTKMLDILEAFINLYGYTYMRLDGSTLPEERQTLMQRFNTNPKIFLFILSTRSGGVGINLVGADTVIFYDSDWNPAMDQQAQDRCHRIGQTREVHIYRLISESTIEENILKKANQKRALDNLVIQSGGYNTEFFKKLNPMELLSGHQAVVTTQKAQVEEDGNDGSEIPLSNADVEAALKHAEDEADYMALKKVEQEEAVDNQEFTEEAMGKLEDDELVNDDDIKVEEGGDDGGLTLQSNTDCGVVRTSNTDPDGLTAATSARDSGGVLDFHDPIEDGSLDLVGKVDDFDMIADVKEMATAASVSGQTVLTFENQLRPIDQYAIRFLELWDPIIDKNAAETQVQFEEKEWELDRIEKLKEDMEADVDDDEEPLLYERWDADFATEVYHQQVEALAQHQLMEELESEAKKKELAECGNSDSARIRRKPKSKKKAKKTKLKSLKKGGLSSESKTVKKLTQLEFMSSDEDAFSDDVSTNSGAFSDQPVFLKKRKLGPYDYEKRSKKSKKTDKGPETGSLVVDDKLPNKPLNAKYSKNGETTSTVDTESKSASKSASKSKTCVKFSITPMPVNRFVTIKHEKKPKKKGGNIWKDHFPLPDTWMPQEDVVLCGSVHEYGPNWELASELLYNATAGGVYRGRYRHPVHCCERFRDLMQRHVLSGNEAVNNDKASNTGSGKALLRVTEDNIKMLLNAVSEQLDHEPLIQRHFFSIISSVWRVSCNASCSRSSSIMSRNSSYSSSQSSINHEPSQKARSTNSIACSKLVAAALDDSDRTRKIDEEAICSNTKKKTDCRSENLDILLEISLEKDDISFGMPSLIRVSIPDPRVPPAPPMHFGLDKHLRSSSQDRTENQFRVASRACAEDCLGWGSLAFSAGDIKSRTPAKSQSSGKHKLTVTDSVKSSKSKSRKPVVECSNNANNSVPEQTQTSYISGFEQHDLSTSIPEGGLGCDPPFHLNNELVDGNVDSFDMFPHEYDPGLTSSLDDYLPFPEFTDVG